MGLRFARTIAGVSHSDQRLLEPTLVLSSQEPDQGNFTLRLNACNVFKDRTVYLIIENASDQWTVGYLLSLIKQRERIAKSYLRLCIVEDRHFPSRILTDKKKTLAFYGVTPTTDLRLSVRFPQTCRTGYSTAIGRGRGTAILSSDSD